MTRQEILDKLVAHADELRARGIRHAELFGSFARADARFASDIDLAIEIDDSMGLSGYEIVGLQDELSTLLGRRVDLIVKPVRRPSLREEIERDGVLAF